jgi:hypothetical protein
VPTLELLALDLDEDDETTELILDDALDTEGVLDCTDKLDELAGAWELLGVPDAPHATKPVTNAAQ